MRLRLHKVTKKLPHYSHKTGMVLCSEVTWTTILAAVRVSVNQSAYSLQ